CPTATWQESAAWQSPSLVHG
ncbi:hypothetical protein NFI96_017711, partial [Prochilodus magdalenae]